MKNEIIKLKKNVASKAYSFLGGDTHVPLSVRVTQGRRWCVPIAFQRYLRTRIC